LDYNRNNFMDTTAMLVELRTELDAVNEAIQVLERLSQGQGKRRGRPPKWMATDGAEQSDGEPAAAKKRRKRLGGS
jgi:hypothetical protein